MRRTISVPGKPVPQGSLRSFKQKSGAVVTPQAPKVLVYRNDIRNQWGEPKPMEGEVSVTVVAEFQRPKSHMTSKGILRKGAPWAMTQSPDIDKVVRAVLDALTGYAFVDDKQVVRVHAVKGWVTYPSQTLITVEVS